MASIFTIKQVAKIEPIYVAVQISLENGHTLNIKTTPKIQGSESLCAVNLKTVNDLGNECVSSLTIYSTTSSAHLNCDKQVRIIDIIQNPIPPYVCTFTIN